MVYEYDRECWEGVGQPLMERKRGGGGWRRVKIKLPYYRERELKDLVWKTVESAGKPNLSDYFPVLKRFDLQGVRKRARLHYDRMHQIFDNMIDKRMKARALDSTTRNGDFLDVLLDQWEENRSILNRDTIKPLI